LESISVLGSLHGSIPQRAELNHNLRAALALARRGIPVFPLRPGTKEPLYGSRGFYDATTDEEQIRRWWTAMPDANIGVPTGKRTGFWTLDVDRDGWGFGSLDALAEEHSELSKTTTVLTGGGGLQFHFRLPPGLEIRNSAGKLGMGLDVRGEGGYVVVPPSRTTGEYQWLEKVPPADAPEWLVEAARKRTQEPVREPRKVARSAGAASSARETESVDISGPPITYGRRNDTLTRIAGKLHDGTRTLEQLAADLRAINQARCQPPIGEHPSDRDPREVAKIAASIHRLQPCKRSAPGPDEETLEALDRIEATHLWGRSWKGAKWKVPRSVFVSLIKEARLHGEKIPAGVRFTLGIRSLALAAASSKPSVLKAIRLLRELGMVRKDDAERSGTQAGAFVLVDPVDVVDSHDTLTTFVRAKVDHSPIESGQQGREARWPSGKTLRAPLTAPRLRWSSPGGKGRRAGVVPGTHRVRQTPRAEARVTVKRLGKTAEQVVDQLEAAGGSLSMEDLAEAMGSKRPRDLRRRVISRLVDARVVVVVDNVVSLAEDWLEHLNEERELAGEIEAYRADMRCYAAERDAYRARLEGEGDEQRVRAQQVQHNTGEEPPADGAISELVGDPEPESTRTSILSTLGVDPVDPSAGLAEPEHVETEETKPEVESSRTRFLDTSILAALNDEEGEALGAVLDYELYCEPFGWSWGDWKGLFYWRSPRTGETTGRWPDDLESLARIRAAYHELERAAA
jgi:hypothetical protein